MMNHGRISKGEYGYRDKERYWRIAITALLLLSVLVQVAIRTFTTMSAFRVLFTITAVLTVLPMGVIAAPLLASWKYKTPSKDFYDLIRPYEKKFLILYDLILTTKDQIIPLDAVIVHPTGIFGYCPDVKLDEKKAESDLLALFKQNRLDAKIHIMKDLKGFERRLESLKPASEYGDEVKTEACAQLLETLCM